MHTHTQKCTHTANKVPMHFTGGCSVHLVQNTNYRYQSLLFFSRIDLACTDRSCNTSCITNQSMCVLHHKAGATATVATVLAVALPRH